MVVVLGDGVSGKGAKELLDFLNIENLVINDKYDFSSLKNIEYVIKSPGISWDKRIVTYFLENNIKILSEVEFALKYLPKDIKIIGITGTNGKTTTATKTYEILSTKYSVMLAGNVGTSVSVLTKKILQENIKLDIMVLELSSYQLDNLSVIPLDVALITNLTPDHLTRYKSLDDYYKTKFNIFNNLRNKALVIINDDDLEFKRLFTKDLLDKFNKNNVKISHISVNKDIEYDKSKFSLKGKHNLENIMFIIEIANYFNISKDIIKNFLYTTKSLVHRMQHVLNYKKLEFINDSKGTNPDSTIKAINSYDKEIILLLGGDNKNVDNKKMCENIKDKVSYVYLYGANKNILEEDLKKVNYNNYSKFNTIEEILNDIKKNRQNEEKVILFSPATSSFDQFNNFEHRGEIFMKLVNEIFKEKNV